MRPQGLAAELLLASSEQQSAAQAAALSPAQVAELLGHFSVAKGALRFAGGPLKSAWRLSGVLALMAGWPGLTQLKGLAMRADPDWAPDFGILAEMTSLRELRLSLSRHPIPPLPAGLLSLRVDLPGSLDLEHPKLRSLHLYGADCALPDWSGLPSLEQLVLERMDIQRLRALPDGLRTLELAELPLLESLPPLGAQVQLRTLRCPRLP